jgi:hypothetical protein
VVSGTEGKGDLAFSDGGFDVLDLGFGGAARHLEDV